VLAELMRSGELERHHRLLRRRPIRHRDAMIGAVRQHLPQASVHGAAAGLHLTLTFGGSLSDVEVAGAALECGVKIPPLSWHGQLGCPPGLVLGYAASTTAAIEEGIEILGRILRARRRPVTARDRRQRAC
jgi:GntR family transcriptional regulator/MocR family aminotransferase